MNDLDPAELSAFLDGELDPSRARQIEALIAADPEARAAFDQLSLADHRLRSIAEAAAFRPQIRWPEPAVQSAAPWLVPPLVGILLAWSMGKLAPATTVSVIVSAAALVLFIAWLAPLALREARDGGTFAA